MRIKKRGIYVVQDNTAAKVYLGSTEDKDHRFKKHSIDLKRNVHHNKHLQTAFNQGNELQVLFIPVKDDVVVKEIEQVLLDEFIDTGILYNIARDTNTASGFTGQKHTPETLALLSELAKERGVPRATIEAGAAARLGVKLSPERVEALRQVNIERMKSPEAREHLSRINLGVKHTPEAIEKMKEACEGRTFTEQAKEARLLATKGRKVPAEELARRVQTLTGQVRSGQALANLTEAAEKRAKPVIANGVRYNSTKELAVAFNITPSAAKRRIIRNTGNYRDWKYEEA